MTRKAIKRFRDWFASMWSPSKARMIAADYATIGAHHRYFLLDVAARGGLFSTAPYGADATTLAILEGRRQLAIETIQLANCDPAVLFELMPREPQQPETRK